MENTTKVNLFGYQLGFYIQETNSSKNRDYELSSAFSTLLNCPEEDIKLWRLEIKKFIDLTISNLKLLEEDIIKVKNLKLNLVNIDSFAISTYYVIYNNIQTHIPHLLWYYLKYDKQLILELLNKANDVFNILPNVKINNVVYYSYHNGIINITRDILKLGDEVNLFNKTLNRLKDNNNYFNIDNFDITDIVKIYI